MLRPLVVSIVLSMLVSCVVDDELELESTEQALVSSLLRNPMEPPTDGIGVYKLYGNQLSRLPVSFFFRASVAPAAAHHLLVRTECPGGAEAEYRDTGLYVVKKTYQRFFGWKVGDAVFNDDCNGQSGCWCPTCSRVDLGTSATGATYDIYAFSARRTAARCNVRYSSDNGTSWVSASSGLTDLGGALVDVGPVRRGGPESFEIKTLESESSFADLPALRANTHMLLFDLGGAATATTGVYRSTSVPVFAYSQPSGDTDPKIGPSIPTTQIRLVACANPPCISPAPRHLLLIGKETPGVPTPATAGDIEATVDIIREPRDSAGNANGTITAAMPSVPSASTSYTCSTPVTLEPGRYGAALPARSMREYGRGEPADGFAGAACTMITELMSAFTYENALIPACDQGYFYRGEGNWRALVMKVQALGTGDDIWRSVTPERTVPNGGLGCRYGQCWDTLREDFELWLPSQVRVCVALRDPRIGVGSTVRLEKTPAFSELKVATLNIHQSSGGGLTSSGEFMNAANLLATRGRLVPERRTVAELATTAPFEWAADIVMLQEVETADLAAQFVSQAEKLTDLDWRFVHGKGKDIPAVDYTSLNTVATHELLVPGGAAGTITARDTTRCTSGPGSAGADHKSECYNADWLDGTWISGNGIAAATFYTYSVPAKVAVRRWSAGVDTPILAYSVILEPHHRFTQRRAELESLIQTIKAHMTAAPTMTNAAGDPTPTAAGHRVILAGDFNILPHEVGENRWFIRRLREEFGYAVDAAAADRDSWANFYDMHSFRGATSSPDDGLPQPYTEGEHWQATTNQGLKFWWGSSTWWPHYFPYWASTYHGVTNDYGAGRERERHDLVLLVGKGWAADDPVRKYMVMHTTTQYDSPFAIKDTSGRVLAVDIAPYNEGGDVDVPNVSDGRKNYAPQYPVNPFSAPGMNFNDQCTNSGCAAIESDHIPVGVRLRVTR